MNRRALVTGFEPFGPHGLNPSAMLAQRLNGCTIAGTEIHALVLPVAQGRAGTVLRDALTRLQPELVISLGLAAGRSRLALERVGINVLDFPIADNDGMQPADEPVVPGGPAAYFSTLPLRAILAAWEREGVPGYISNTAGTYLCNEILYRSLHLAAGAGYRAGFIHLPCLPEQAAGSERDMPSMSLEVMQRGVELTIETSLTPTAPTPALTTGAVS